MRESATLLLGFLCGAAVGLAPSPTAGDAPVDSAADGERPEPSFAIDLLLADQLQGYGDCPDCERLQSTESQVSSFVAVAGKRYRAELDVYRGSAALDVMGHAVVDAECSASRVRAECSFAVTEQSTVRLRVRSGERGADFNLTVSGE
ncbi:MAG: hypothetical protein AAGF12_10825 [Myxococcota bacterium]